MRSLERSRYSKPQYTVSINHNERNNDKKTASSVGEPAWERASYARRQLLSELGLAQWRTPDFWAMILMLLFTFLLRVLFHYGGQLLLLLAMKKSYNM